MTIPELLPCPFCGGEAELISPTETDRWAQVSCKMCGCRGTEYPAAVEHAVAAWNKRAPLLMGVQRPDREALTNAARPIFEKWLPLAVAHTQAVEVADAILCAAPASPRAEGEWQPIETAPKDGRTFLGVWWSDIRMCAPQQSHIGICWWAGGWYPYARTLTHWRPLPAPPVQQAMIADQQQPEAK